MNSFLSDATVERIKSTLRARGFATRLQVADPPRSIAFDRGGTLIAAQAVVIVWANREPAGEGSATTDVIGTQGELQKWQMLDARVGDLFTLDGLTGEITDPVRVDDGVAKAGFRLLSGRA